MSPSNESLEQEIADLERRLQEKRSQQGPEGEPKPEQEHEYRDVHAAVGERFQEQIPDFQPKQPKHAPGETSYDDPAIRDQIQSFVNIAFTQDPYTAIAKAVETKQPRLIDALHDVLADEFYQELTDRKKMKPAS